MRSIILLLTIAGFVMLGGIAANSQSEGTQQMEGQWGEIGKEYTLGKAENDPMNFTLRSVEFVTTRVTVGDNTWVPKGNEKFLVLHYTIHNPQNEERSASWNSFDFTAIDSTNQSNEFTQNVGQEDNSLEIGGSFSLKPAQEVKVYTFIIVPAKGVVPKLIVKRGEGPVLRYDLKDKVAPLAAPYADPSDLTGFTSLADVPSVMGTFYPIGMFDFRLDSVSYTGDTINEMTPEEGSQFLVLNVTFKNMTGEKQSVYFNAFNPSVKAESGESIDFNQYLLSATRDSELSTEVNPGQEIKGRMFFQVFTDDPATNFVMVEGWEENARTFSFGV
jgi:hypothetical protein